MSKRRAVKEQPQPEAPTEDQVAVRAYEIWVERGRPEGTDREVWFEAERPPRRSTEPDVRPVPVGRNCPPVTTASPLTPGDLPCIDRPSLEHRWTRPRTTPDPHRRDRRGD